MNARALAGWTLAAVFVALATTNPVYRVLVALAALNVVLATLLPGRSARPLLRAVIFAALASVALNLLLSRAGDHAFAAVPAQVPLVAGPLTLESVAFGVTAAAGLCAAVLAVAPLSLSLEAHELVDALPRPLERTGAAVAAALNLVPGIATSFTAVREAQLMRGWRARRLSSWNEVLVPVVLTAIEDSIRLAEVMEARAFGSGRRVQFAKRGWSPRDTAVAGAAVMAVALFAYSRWRGSAGDWYPYPSLAWPDVDPLAVMACVLLAAPGLAWRSRRCGG